MAAGGGLADTVPFRHVYIHGLIRDADRQKMSKTKGNVVDPIEIIERFGTDAVRFTLASMASPGTDIAFSEARTEGNRAFCEQDLECGAVPFSADGPGGGRRGMTWGVRALPAELPEGTPLETRWMVSRLRAVCGEVERALGDYRFDEAAHAAYQFFWGEFCDWYLELAKQRLEFPEGASERNEVTALTLGGAGGSI